MSRRRRRRGHPVVAALAVLAVLAVLALAVWVSHHLLLIALVAGGGTWFWQRRRHRLLGAAAEREWLQQEAREAAAREEALRREHLFEAAASQERLRRLSPSEFEEVVGMALAQDGWHLRRAGGPGDGGVDLTGRDPQGRPAVVQCKRWSGSIGTPVVRDLLGAKLDAGADVAALAHTGRLTASARALAKRNNVIVLDAVAIARLARWGSPNDPPEGETPETGRGAAS